MKSFISRSAAWRRALEANEAKINAELIAAQGKPVDTGGYYLPDQKKNIGRNAAECGAERCT